VKVDEISGEKIAVEYIILSKLEFLQENRYKDI